jgi:hypothetical protein
MDEQKRGPLWLNFPNLGSLLLNFGKILAAQIYLINHLFNKGGLNNFLYIKKQIK